MLVYTSDRGLHLLKKRFRQPQVPLCPAHRNVTFEPTNNGSFAASGLRILFLVQMAQFFNENQIRSEHRSTKAISRNAIDYNFIAFFFPPSGYVQQFLRNRYRRDLFPVFSSRSGPKHVAGACI